MPIEDDVNEFEIQKRRDRTSSYSDDYKQVAFQIWYSNNRPSATALKKMLPSDEKNRIPTEMIISQWMDIWNEDADRLDLEVKKSIDLDLVSQRAEMLKRQAQNARFIQDKAMEYLTAHGFDKAGDAIRGLVEGTRIERESRGLGEALDRIFKMDDEALRKELEYLLNRDRDVIVDGEVLEVDDADSEHIPTE